MIIPQNKILEAQDAAMRDQLIEGMMIMNVMSVPFRAIDKAFDLACNSTDITQKACQLVGKTINAIIGLAPESFRNPLTLVTNGKGATNSEIAKLWEQKYGIPEEETKSSFESMQIIGEGIIAAGVGGAAGKVASAAMKQASRLVHSARASRPVSQVAPTRITTETVIDLTENQVRGRLELTIHRIGSALEIHIDHLEHLGPRNRKTFGTDSIGTQSSGTFHQALRKIKEIAKMEKVTDVKLQWVPDNKRLLG
ncbi:MAG: hypothetical protein JSR46_09000, partial [Verrucomicrobia bacterium]|nr:hypothetical protein [Verrucomicrobiota bacterium]